MLIQRPAEIAADVAGTETVRAEAAENDAADPAQSLTRCLIHEVYQCHRYLYPALSQLLVIHVQRTSCGRELYGVIGDKFFLIPLQRYSKVVRVEACLGLQEICEVERVGVMN